MDEDNVEKSVVDNTSGELELTRDQEKKEYTEREKQNAQTIPDQANMSELSVATRLHSTATGLTVDAPSSKGSSVRSLRLGEDSSVRSLRIGEESSVKSLRNGEGNNELNSNKEHNQGSNGGESPRVSVKAESGTGSEYETDSEADLEPPDLIPIIKDQIMISGLDKQNCWTTELEDLMQNWVYDTSIKLLVFYNDRDNGLCGLNSIPTNTVEEMAYFLKPTDYTFKTVESFYAVCQFGTITLSHIHSLLKMMNGVFAPLFLENKSWPDSIKNDFSGQLHKFLGSLTDTRYKMEGYTVLYVPSEGSGRSIEDASKDKEFVQRLETAMIHWTRQIKEVLSSQDALETAENTGPLEEIAFWKNRCADLSGISEQLNKDGVTRIQTILERAKSSYVAPFSKLSKQIQDGSAQAQGNRKFLEILKEPCRELAKAPPKDIPPLLPKLINTIRVIWVNSEYYNTPERLTGMFRKVSNEIINRCCNEISLEKIFVGYVTSSMKTLNESIECCKAWKRTYTHLSAIHVKFGTSNTDWVLDPTSIFAQVDAFIQRCRDLLEVCECQHHFSRFSEGEKMPIPSFPGQRGLEIARSLREIDYAFQKNLNILIAIKKNILDVKATMWHDEYNRFRSGVKDMEVMMTNTINSSYETVKTVQEGIEILGLFQHLNCRESIKRTLEKKIADIFGLFNNELNLVKKELSRKTAWLTRIQPNYAGGAHWAKALKRRIDKVMTTIEEAWFLPETGVGEEARGNYLQLAQWLDEYVRKNFGEWTTSLDKEPIRRLEVPLMARNQEKHSMIEVNFDRILLKMFQEIYYWERILFEVPHYAAEVYQRKEELRILRMNVSSVVGDYNRINNALTQEERGLFRERIRYLDKKIVPGLSKLTWVSKLGSDFFVKECRNHAAKVQTVIDEYKLANIKISRLCKQISELLLVRIDGHKIYKLEQFEDDFENHRGSTTDRLAALHEDIVKILQKTHVFFEKDGYEVHNYWFRYMEKMDRMVEEAFRLNIKWSLQDVSKAINGDGKSPPNPLFRVQVVLEKDKVEFSPTLNALATAVNDISITLTETLMPVERLPDLLSAKKTNKDPIYKIIEEDTEIIKLQTIIRQGLVENATHLRTYLSTWAEYGDIWEVNKDAFIRRYQKMNPNVASFDSDIGRYTEVANNAQKEETVLTREFIMLDCSPLKMAILSHCLTWQNKFTELLREMASTALVNLTEYLKVSSERLLKPPSTLDELGASLELLEKIEAEMPKIEAKILPIHEQFAILEKYEVSIDEETQRLLDNVGAEWDLFKENVAEAEQMLKKHKDKFKTGLIHSADDFKRQVTSLVEDFHTNGPFTSNTTPDDALAAIAAIREQLAVLKSQEETIRRGLHIFKIDQPPSKEIIQLEKELEQLENAWLMTKNWDEKWVEWKGHSFHSLDVEALKFQSQQLFKKLNRLGREVKDKKWEIMDSTKGKIDQFIRTLPLILDLRNAAMRHRHWQQLKDVIGKEFEHDSDEFTLEVIIELQLDQHADKIAEISGAASKELSIEMAIKTIEDAWKEIYLDIAPHKEKGHFKLKATEDLFLTLEDNQMTLSTIKASRYVKAFEKEVDTWERTLSRIMEVVEVILTVQKQWMYLENIFLGEDIRKQLPRESADFDNVNTNWKEIMTRLNKDNNALRGTSRPGMLEMLNEMNSKLEDIQKSLDMYLETKRQIFPRFYFISNDDLLEILGQSKNPEAVQPHLKKCFDNIFKLKMQRMGITAKYEAAGMFSADGEYVEFTHPVLLEGPVEGWLCDIERFMRLTLKDLLKQCKLALKKNMSKRDKWSKDWAGQLLITTSQMQWTADVTKALAAVKERESKKPLKSMKRKQVTMLEKFTEAIRGNMSKIQRAKIVALVTIEVHARDVIEKLIKTGASDVSAFEWLSQLRVYWDKEIDDCVVRQTNTQFQYGYEYLGNSGRLVITPLTDRCYMTLTTALNLNRGGSPKGPAGTGKTETTKDLGKALGNYVIVINCSEGLDYKSMGRMYSGLSQTGAWGCFDEFNRINIEVLSVVAQQILAILSALSKGFQRFAFEGREINLVWSCGIFITMNPGYAGRTELPDNLKSMFRPIAMVVPDSAYIAEIILFGEGFSNTRLLAKKVHTLYSLAMQQLSKQDHYDFGLRALVSVLKYSGRKKRSNPEMPEEEVLLLGMNDMNIPKFTASDRPLFNGIVQDLFPGVDTPQIDYTKLVSVIKSQLVKFGYQCTENTINKVIQLHETKNSRHSVMIVGKTGSGKSVTWKTLQASLCKLAKTDNNYAKVLEYIINPKALSLGELYGEFDLNTNEWTDGVLSCVMRATCSDEKPDQKWLIFDGPVDTLWIESMNSVMDDNKVLTLINGERIAMPDQVSLLFEVEDLSVASPATVSRCGMVYNDYVDLGWKPYVDSWLEKRPQKASVDHLKKLFDKYIAKVLEFKAKNCTELIPISEINGIVALCRLFDALATPEHGVNPSEEGTYGAMIELWFTFSMIWSICASVEEDSRKKLDTFIREMEGSFPNKDTIYEYSVESKNRTWAHWEEKLKGGWKLQQNIPFYKLIVPTVDTVRYEFLLDSLLRKEIPTLLVGPVGTGKTSVAGSALEKIDKAVYTLQIINLSAQTSSNNVQDIIENKVEKRTKGVFVPIGGKKMITFLDDFNMPAKDTFGSQPPLELIRQWMDYNFWYDRQKQVPKEIRDMYLLAAMGPPGGGRMEISRRLQSRFNLINMTFPSESQIRRIFGSMINQKLISFEEDIKPVGDIMTQATIELYEAVISRYLPTPSKIHYLFNLRDISRVFQGLLRCSKNYHDTKTAMTRLWIHECFRVFADRLNDPKDYDDFVNIMSDKIGTLFDQTFHNVCPNKQPPIFGSFMKETGMYEDIQNIKELKTFMENQLEDYNMSPGFIGMNLVLFKDAIEHVCRIIRVISQPRGNMLLIGIGGSGRQSLSRLAAYVLEYSTFQIEITKNYRRQEWYDDLKKLYSMAGVENKQTMFLFNDTQIVLESLLEDVNNILNSGEIPNLYKPEEFEEVKALLIDEARAANVSETPEGIFKFLITRVRSNLHVILCMSPVGEPFRNRIRMYPALVNCTAIDYFSEWPRDALLEVAEKYLDNLDLGEPEINTNVATMFVIMHQSVTEMSRKMLLEMKRHNYTTPTNYLELVTGYKKLLAEKGKEIGDHMNKLKNGLNKIDDTRSKVEVMSVDLDIAKTKLAQFQKQCEEYLVVIVQQKREVDDQQKSVTARSEKIREEEVKCKEMADTALEDLKVAMPALEEAVKALESLNKGDITEIKSYVKPPPMVEKVLESVMILRGKEPTWAEAKREMGDQNFIKKLVNFDKENMSDRTLKKLAAYCNQPDFQPDIVGRVSGAAKSLCMWARAMEVYGRVYRVVLPKKQRLMHAQKMLTEKQENLAEAQRKLEEVNAKMEELKKTYEEKIAQKEELNQKKIQMEIQLDRAAKLISGLAGERERWQETVGQLEESMGYLVGDCLVASACMSYTGPFLSNYRDEFINKRWLPQIRELRIPGNRSFTFSNFLSNPTTVREWNIQGLPSDTFSTENGIMVTRGTRWPLMVDPQSQAIKWIKKMEKKRGLKIIDLQQHDYMRTLENAIQFGTPVLLQNVHEELDPSLNPILNKSLVKVGGRYLMRIGDKELEYNSEFKFYMTTKLSNPHYTPEIAAKTTIVNFAVKEQGLEAQLLGIVVRKERPELEEQKDSLVVNIASGKRKIQELENEILRLLNEAEGSLLENEELVNTLQSSKVTSQEVTEQLSMSEQTEIKIDTAREGYRPCATRASILFFVLIDMGRIDPMYQFSLDAYINLFNGSIDKSHRSPKLQDRINNMNEYHTYAVYRYTCRGLFEKHKLLFSFHMCSKILENAGKINMDEFNFFLRGGVVLDKDEQLDNPCSNFLPETAWDNISEMDKLTNFHGIITSFEQYPRDWNIWFTNSSPEASPLPGEWENACNELQRMLITRCLRPDRVSFCVTTFIINNLGSRFVEPPVLDMNSVVEDSSTKTPLIFVLSTGVDPTGALMNLATQVGMAKRFQALSLGQGQAPIATRMIKDGVKEGIWVFLANCHLSLSWMPQLDKLIDQLQVEEPHKDFRLWLSSSPNPDFPISILQAGIKMTTEPPKGIKANMKRLYNVISEQQFTRCKKHDKYRRLLFSLCFFHSVLLERRKFLQMGWNVQYDFNNSDFEVSENLLNIYLDEYDETPWDALKYLIAGVNYGGHVTDDYDRRVLHTYINEYFNEQVLQTNFYKLSVLPTYCVPKDGHLRSYKEYINLLPHMDHPEAFGQHANADIASQIAETKLLFDTLLSLQPQVKMGEGESREDKVLALSADVLTKIPENMDYGDIQKILKEELNPLNIVLLQEIERYNALLTLIRKSLIDLENGIRGLVVMSADLEETFDCIFKTRVPPLWGKAYASMKNLGPWTRDLVQRVHQLNKWGTTSHTPMVFWLSGFTFPTGFLTAVLQTAARKNNISIDTLSWEFIVLTIDDSNLTGPPKDGVYIKGLYMEGASWDQKNSCLIESEPMQLVTSIPTIHFKPAENKKKSSKGVYVCPCYYYPIRSGEAGRPSFVVSVDLKSGANTADHWIKRGTALLMSLAE